MSQPPVRITEASDTTPDDTAEPVVLETPRFMTVVWGAGGQSDEPTTIVQLDGHGAYWLGVWGGGEAYYV